MNEIPRRACLDRLTPAERAIFDAMQAVEAMAADPQLTDAVVLLQQARDRVADYVDGVAGAAVSLGRANNRRVIHRCTCGLDLVEGQCLDAAASPQETTKHEHM